MVHGITPKGFLKMDIQQGARHYTQHNHKFTNNRIEEWFARNGSILNAKKREKKWESRFLCVCVCKIAQVDKAKWHYGVNAWNFVEIQSQIIDSKYKREQRPMFEYTKAMMEN